MSGTLVTKSNISVKIKYRIAFLPSCWILIRNRQIESKSRRAKNLNADIWNNPPFNTMQWICHLSSRRVILKKITERSEYRRMAFCKFSIYADCFQGDFQYPTAIPHGMHCIGRQVHQHLVYLSGVGQHLAVTGDITADLDAAWQRGA